MTLKKKYYLRRTTFCYRAVYSLKKKKMKKEKKHLPVPENKHLEFDHHLLENEVWLTTEEAMIHLNVSRSTMYRLRKKKLIPSFKLGHSPMYPKHLLNKLFMHRALQNLK
jgi:hypothetical protein